MDALLENVYTLFESLINESEDKMYLHLNSSYKQGELFISAPEFLINLFKQALSYKYHQYSTSGGASGAVGKVLIFRNIEIIPTHEMAVTLFHKDYPLYRKDWMVNRILLMPLVETKKEWYSKIVISLNDYFKFPVSTFGMN